MSVVMTPAAATATSPVVYIATGSVGQCTAHIGTSPASNQLKSPIPPPILQIIWISFEIGVPSE